MGEAKRRKLLDPNYGKTPKLREIAIFPIFSSALTPSLLRLILDKYNAAKEKSFEPIFIFRAENGGAYPIGFASVVTIWLESNGVSNEITSKFIFPNPLDDEEKILGDRLAEITLKAKKKLPVTFVFDEDPYSQQFKADLHGLLK